MDDTHLLLDLVKQGDKKARDTLVEENLGLVRHVVKRFLSWGYEPEELFQVGCIGLMKAIDKFDTTYQVQFSTYAVPLIQGEIRRFLRDDGMVKVSRSISENGWKLQKIRNELIRKLGREPTLSELQKQCDLYRDDIIMALNASGEVESLQKTVFQSGDQELCLGDQVVAGEGSCVGRTVAGGLLRDEGGMYEEPEKEHILNSILLQQIFEKLTSQERQVIELRFFEDKTQTQVARELGLNQVKISRMEKKILLYMRGCLTEV